MDKIERRLRRLPNNTLYSFALNVNKLIKRRRLKIWRVFLPGTDIGRPSRASSGCFSKIFLLLFNYNDEFKKD
jgi:hypothetical protein